MRISEDNRRGIFLDNLFHLDDDFSTFCRIEFGGKLVGKGIIFRIGIAGAVLRVRTVYIGLPIHIDEDFGVACLFGQDIGNQEIVIAARADTVQNVVIDILEIDFNADFLRIRLGRFRKERQFCTTGIENEIKFQILSVFIDITVTVRIFPTGFLKEFLCIFHIRLIRVGCIEFIKAEINRRRKQRAAGRKGIFQEHFAIGLAIERLQKRFADSLVSHRLPFLDGNTSQYVTNGRNRRCRIFGSVGKELHITGSDIDRHIDFPFLERHRAGIRIINRIDDCMLKRNGIIIVRIGIKFRLCFGEGFHHVRTGADRTLLCKIYFAIGIYIDNDEERVAQHPGKRCDRFRSINRHILTVRHNVIEFKHCFGTRCFSKRTLNRFLDRFARDRSAVRELNIFNLECPRHLVIGNFPAFGNPRFGIHLIIKMNQAFADAVAHNLPTEIIIGRFQAIGKIRDAYRQSLLRSLRRFPGISAASQAKSQKSGRRHNRTSLINRFHYIRFLSLLEMENKKYTDSLHLLP